MHDANMFVQGISGESSRAACITRANGVDVVIRAMQRFESDGALQEAGCWVLWHLGVTGTFAAFHFFGVIQSSVKLCWGNHNPMG